MIIGSGDIASVLPDRDDLVFFASGVSNSQETRESEFRREKDLLFDQDYEKHIIYFSTLSVFYSSTKYAHHKKRMEAFVKMFKKHTIIRIGNITWGTNPHTLINYFKAQRERGEELVIQDTYRYVVDKEEFLHWIGLIPDWSCEMNIPGRKMKVVDIVNEFVL